MVMGTIARNMGGFAGRTAFFIGGDSISYGELALMVQGVRDAIDGLSLDTGDLVGVMAHDDAWTYAALYGAWFSGQGFVPVNPANPVDRNASILEQSGVKHVFCHSFDLETDALKTRFKGSVNFHLSPQCLSKRPLQPPCETGADELAYLLFTSGSTGVPKGVPVTRANLQAFIDGFWSLGYKMDETDKFLQMFDLTFDLSVMCYVVPLLVGGSVYTVPAAGVKYTQIYSLLEEHQLTVALMVPSILSYLRPYFEDIRLESLRYSLFCGEALYSDIAGEWAACAPNALVQNVYGPTEATIFCLTYDRPLGGCVVKSASGIMCIGRPMERVRAIVVDDNCRPVERGEKGEVCLGGEQLTPGYWQDSEKTRQAFFQLEVDGERHRYYRTGDIGFQDQDGDFFFCGRLDHQVKVQGGFRVELSEVEHHARAASGKNVAAVATPNAVGTTEIHLFVEDIDLSVDDLYRKLRLRLPSYMMPAGISALAVFPLNVNGKVDRKALKASLAGEGGQ